MVSNSRSAERIQKLEKRYDELISSYGLIREKLKLDDETSQIQFQLFQREIDESKIEINKSKDELERSEREWYETKECYETKEDANYKNRLIYATLAQFCSFFVELLPADKQKKITTSRELLTGLLPATTANCSKGNTIEKEFPGFLLSPADSGRRTTDEDDCANSKTIGENNGDYSLVVKTTQLLKLQLAKQDQVIRTLQYEVNVLKNSKFERKKERRISRYSSALSIFIDDDNDESDSSKQRQDGEPTENAITINEEELEHHFMPNDTFSYLAVSPYFKRRGKCCHPTMAFTLAFFCICFQLTTSFIFMWDNVDFRNPTNPIVVPSGVGIQVRISQFIALLISCWNQDEIRASFNVLSVGYHEEKVRAIGLGSSRLKWYFSIAIRIMVGCVTLIVTFILIMNSRSVRNVMLDFAAVTFVSELDNGVFLLAVWGYLGEQMQGISMSIKTKSVYDQEILEGKRSRVKKVPRLVSLLTILVAMTAFWAWITGRQASGYFVDEAISVQFGDEFLPAMGAFSGTYIRELDDTLDGMRVTYVELASRKAQFSYCLQHNAWVFDFREDLDELSYIDECVWKAKSTKKLLDFDIVKSSRLPWFVLDEMSLEYPLQHFYVMGQEFFDGKPCRGSDDCGDRLYCSHDKVCVCKDGLFGEVCEFEEPCPTLELDPRDENGFSGTRSWSRKWLSLQDKSQKRNLLRVYGKPIYVGDDNGGSGSIEVMMFTGRRWIITDSDHIHDYQPSSDASARTMAEFLSDNFHAYWSNYTFFFISEAVDKGTPTHSATPVGMQWFRLETTNGTEGASLRSGRALWKGEMDIEANLICSTCNSKTNPCFYGATCQYDGTCECNTGSSGSLCQIPPSGNGLCDAFFNTPEFGFDGGDCCEESCISTEEYVCGRAYINSGGVSSYGFIGYPNCKDPRFSSKLSGSKTLYQVLERGSVRCGLGILDGWIRQNEDGSYSGFEVDLCKGIAGAALGDPEGIEIVETSWATRFEELGEEKFDVLLIPTTFTAERDIYQMDAELGFSFASHCYMFDGLRFGGIPQFTHCADNVDFNSLECLELKICVVESATWYPIVQEHFPGSMIVVLESVQATYEALEAGHCNVISGELITLVEFAVRDGGFTGPEYMIGNNMFSKEPLAAVTQQNDVVWSKFVSWTFHALIQAEESGITQSTAYKIAATEVFGEHFRNMFKNAVAANGNFGQIFEKHLQTKIPRSGLNRVNNGTTGLIYGFPLGSYEIKGPNPEVGGSIDTIRKRGSLNCGIQVRPGFAELDLATNSWKGFDVDICIGIAAALLGGSPNVNFVALSSLERFEVLAGGTIDVLLGTTTRTLAREVKEPSTGLGFDFTPPVFYDGLSFAGRPFHATCADTLDFGTKNPECFNTKVCVHNGTTWLDQMRSRLEIPERNILVTQHAEDSYQHLILENCNVIAGESAFIAKSTVQKHGWPVDNDYIVGATKYTKEPLAVVTRSDDAQFSDFVRWIIHAFFHAEENGIARDEYFDMPGTINLFGVVFSAMWQHAIAVVGNYGEIFERNFDGILERGGQNNLNAENGPQTFALPGVVVNR